MVRGPSPGAIPRSWARSISPARSRWARPGRASSLAGRFGASLAANDRRLLHATFEIEAESDHAGFVNALPMVHNRWMPAIEGMAATAWTSW